MRLASVRLRDTPGGCSIGVIDPDHRGLVVLDPAIGTVDDVVRGGQDALDRVRAAIEGGVRRRLAEVRLGAPLRRFNRDILCTGWNYLDHFYESAGKREGQDPDSLPIRPTFFTKGPDTVVGPTDPIRFDAALSSRWDYEGELALVVGRDGRSIREEDAMTHVFGWLVANDVSQRDLQRAHGGQWLKGKSLDETMPLGPWVTTIEEVELDELVVECRLNGRLMQQAPTTAMHFSVPRIIAELSSGMTLRAGDVILTGTPSGIGNAREPAVFLAEGDEVVTRIGPLGVLRNRLVAADLPCGAGTAR